MYVYIFIWLFILGIFVNRIEIYNIESDENGELIKRWYLFPAVLLFFPVFWTACMKAPINDVPLYIFSYNSLPTARKDVIEYISNMESGQGFIILEEIIKVIFGGSATAFRIIIALIHSIPIICIFRKYCDDYWIGIYLFVASACHIGWMMNGMRQFIAVVMIFSALPLMLEKKRVKVIIVILLAMTIHISAALMIPVVLIVQGRAWNKKTLLFIIIAIIAMFMFNRNEALVEIFLKGTEYEGSMVSLQSMGDDGVNPLRVLVSAVPMILSLFERKVIQEEKRQLVHICINMSIVTVGMNLVAMVTSGILAGRLAIYTNLYGFLIMPYLIRKGFTQESQKIVNLMLIICYFVYYCFEVGAL